MSRILAGPLLFPDYLAVRRLSTWRNLGLLAVVALATGLFAAFILGWTVLLPETRIAGGCDAGERACHLELPGGGTVQFDLGRRPVLGSEPLTLSVRVTGMDVRRIGVNMVGVVMNMAETRAELRARGDGLFEGEVTLPVCSTGPMDWRAEVSVQGWWSVSVLPFQFYSGSR